MPRFLRDTYSKGWTSVVRFLEDTGISDDKWDKIDQRALHVASKAGDMDEVKRLLEDSAEVHKEDNAGFTALDMAIMHGHLDIAKRLCQEMGVGTSVRDNSAPSLYWAAHLGRVNIVRELIDKGAHINAQTNGGVAP